MKKYKNKKLLVSILLGSACTLIQSLASAQVTLWNDDFTGPGFNPNWTLASAGANSSAPIISAGNAIFDPGTADFGRSFISTNSDSSGNTTLVGNPTFDFFSHNLSITVSDLSFPAAPASGNTNFFAGISDVTTLTNA